VGKARLALLAVMLNPAVKLRRRLAKIGAGCFIEV
jgi:hypothetical protein